MQIEMERADMMRAVIRLQQHLHAYPKDLKNTQ
jgi:ribosomal protein S15P/S13E